MRKAIQDHLRDFLAILGLLTVGLLATYIIVQNQRLRIPLLEEKPFELKAEIPTAQAVMPGQGQTVRVAGRPGRRRRGGRLRGRATRVVTLAIDRKFLPIYKDATILLRPKTGLKDMFFELDPGTTTTRTRTTTSPERRHDPARQHGPGHEPRRDPRGARRRHPGYLACSWSGAGQGLNGRGKDLGKLLGSLGPINQDLARINTEVAKRKENLAPPGPQLEPAHRHASGRTARASTAAGRRPRTRRSERSPSSRRTSSARSRLLGPTLQTTRVALDQDRRSSPRSSARRSTTCGRSPAT